MISTNLLNFIWQTSFLRRYLIGPVRYCAQAVGASERVFQLMDRQSTMAPGGPQKPMGAAEGGEIEFRDVWFAVVSKDSAPELPSNAAVLCSDLVRRHRV